MMYISSSDIIKTRILKQVIRGFDGDNIELFCQPILRTDDVGRDAKQLCKGEVLVRMRDDQGQLITAGVMLAQAERYGFSSKLDRRMLTRTLDTLVSHDEAFRRFDNLVLNLSAYSISNKEFLDFLVDEIRKSHVDPAKLCFEITETAAILDIKAASQLIAVVKDLGCTFALDDFGSGYASYLYLRDLDVDYLKIDGEFVRNMVTDQVNQALVRTMVDMGKILGKQIIAEVVENQATLNMLKDIGVDFVQGYFIGRPVPLEDCLYQLGCKEQHLEVQS